MTLLVRLIRYPAVDVGPAQYLDFRLIGGTPGATIRLLVGGTQRATEVLDANGDIILEGDPGAGGNGIPVTPGPFRNAMSGFGGQENFFTEHPGQGVALLAGTRDLGANSQSWYIEEVAGTP